MPCPHTALNCSSLLYPSPARVLTRQAAHRRQLLRLCHAGKRVASHRQWAYRAGTPDDPHNQKAVREQQRPSQDMEASTPVTRLGPQSSAASTLMLSLLIFLFFMRGLSTVQLYSLIPKLKSLFQLSYTEAMLTQLNFFLGYFIFSLPAAYIVRRLGYLRAIVLGLVVMMAGCLIILPATWVGLYPGFLASLFVLAGGITLLQVADSPLIAMLGSSQGSYSRLTLAQAFNSLGTAVAPILAAWLVFGPTEATFPKQTSDVAGGIRFADLQAIHTPFLVVAGLLAVVTVIFWLNRSFPVPKTDVDNRDPSRRLRLLQNNRFLFGAVAIFLYVGAEVAVASIMASYLMQSTVLSVPAYRASQLLSLYWGGAMCGRFIGAGVLRVVPTGVAH